MSGQAPILLIVDYNLTRVSDVANIARHARQQYDTQAMLIRAQPGARDLEICDYAIDLDPLAQNFVETALNRLAPFRERIRAGVVFSDNAVQRGAELLERLNLPTDSAALAAGAFSKRVYREMEVRIRDLMEAQSIMVPHCSSVVTVDDLRAFAEDHPAGFVVKPSCEGNNRGVIVVRKGDSLETAFAMVEPYLANGAVCEQLIPFRREFSFDGIGETEFITEKVNADGPYPVEVAQILPARLTVTERTTLTRAGRLANMIVGQREGPFHNEIKLSDDGRQAAVVEPNRRPAGMKIWTLAQAVFGINFYGLWVDAALGEKRHVAVVETSTEAATVMLGVPVDGRYAPPGHDKAEALLRKAISHAAAICGIAADVIDVLEYTWLATDARSIPVIPKENSDFAAQVCIAIDGGCSDMRRLVQALRQSWIAALGEETERAAARDDRYCDQVA
ncbi:hypothetical protein R75471_06825 [Paraburkholderia domus]|nr:hypothetical protein R75471_06825 [Paraburkholderia domus]